MTKIDPTNPINNNGYASNSFSGKKGMANSKLPKIPADMHKPAKQVNRYASLSEEERTSLLLEELSKPDSNSYNPKKVALLLKLDFNLDESNGFDETALILAIKNKRSDVASKLIDLGADFELMDKEGKNAFHYALETGDEMFVNKLMRQLCDHTALDSNGANGIMLAAQGGLNNFITKLAKKNVQIDKLDKSCKNALHYAARSPKSSSYAFLLNLGLDPLQKDNDGRTPLHIAVECENYAAIDAHAKMKFDLNPQDNNQKTPLFDAARQNLKFIVQLLLERGADTNISNGNRSGDSLLALTIKDENIEISKLLLKHGADPLHENNYGGTPVHYAASSLPGLIFDIANFVDEFPWYTLGHACRSDKNWNLDSLKVILDKGEKNNIDFPSYDKADYSCLGECIQRKKYDFVNLLLEYGASPFSGSNYRKRSNFMPGRSGYNWAISATLIASVKEELPETLLDNLAFSILADEDGIRKLAEDGLGGGNKKVMQLYLDLMLARGILPEYNIWYHEGFTIENRLIVCNKVGANGSPCEIKFNSYENSVKNALLRNYDSSVLSNIGFEGVRCVDSLAKTEYASSYKKTSETDLTKLENLRFFDFSTLDKGKKYRINDSNMSGFDFASMDLSLLNPNACKRVKINNSKNVPAFIAMHSIGMPKSIHGMNDSQMSELLRKRNAGEFKN